MFHSFSTKRVQLLIAADGGSGKPLQQQHQPARMGDGDADLIAKMRHQCLGKGLSGIKGLAILFRGMDKDYSKTVTLREFQVGVSVDIN